MKFPAIKGLLVLLLILPVFSAQGQQIRLYGSEEGLPNSQINHVYQDRRGYIWIATENGVAYFDGMRFTAFYHDRNRPGSIASDLTTVIYNDSRGRCWVGTADGLQYFDYDYNTFRDFPILSQAATGNYFVSTVIESPDREKILISVSGRGIFVYDAVTHEKDEQTTNMLNAALGTDYVGKLFFDSEGFMWTHSEQGDFFKVDFERKVVNSRLWCPELETISKDVVVSCVAEEPSTGNLLIGTYNHGLLIYDRSIGLIRRAKGPSSAGYRIRTLYCEPAEAGSRGKVWIGTENSGIKYFDPGTEDIRATEYTHPSVDLDNCKVHSIIRDSQGNIWVGIFQKGLLVIPNSTYGFEHITFSDSRTHRDGNVACVTSVLRDRQERLWVGTDGGGLFCMEEGKRPVHYHTGNADLPNNSVMTLTLDNRGTLWISTYMGGITTYTPQEGFRTYSREVGLQRVVCSAYDSEKDIIYFGSHGHGVSTVSIADSRIERFPNPNIQTWVSTLYLDTAGRIWVGRINGLHCYRTGEGSENSYGVIEQTGFSRICSLLEDSHRENTLWVGSADGLIRYDTANDHYTLYSKEDGLPSNVIYAVQQDKSGILWLSTGYGLARFDPETLSVKNFFAYDGLQDNEFRINAFFKDRDDHMYFGGINGLTAFYPETVELWDPPMSNINFTRLTVFNETVEYDPAPVKNTILDRHITQARQITLANDQNVFSLEFSVLEYTNPQKIIYGYMIEGFDADWHYTDASQRVATYTNLPAGNYKMRVKAFFAGNPSESNTVYNEIDIRILPPWQRTWWAIMIYLILLGILTWFIADYLRKDRLRAQEKKESDRKEMKLRMFTDLSHEIRTPLTLVMTPLKSLREGETNSRRKEVYNLMYRNVLRILRLINQLMDMRKIDNHQLNMRFNRTDLIFFVGDIMKSFEQLALIRNIDFRLVSNRESLEVWIDQGNFDKVIFNILSNAFKYTPDNGYVMVSIDTYVNDRNSGLKDDVPEYMELNIENSGSFIREGELERIFERFYQIGDQGNGGSGIGLHLARRLVELHHGVITARNVDSGVVFTVRIPIGSAHLSDEEKADTAKHKDLYYSVRADEKLPTEAEYVQLPGFDPGETGQSKSKRSVVFVDDDADLGKYLALEMSDRYNVESFADGREAWKVISTTLPDVVITDLMMPGFDGLELCRKIRQNPGTNHLPIIVLTSQATEETQQECIECGVDRFLTKPVSLELLRSAIAQAIKTRDMLRNKYRTNVQTDYDQVQMSSPDSRFVTRVIETIRANMENPEFSVDELSREVGMSRVHLNRKLKENINISPSNLIKSIRLKQAAYLLIKHKVNISEVAFKVGFSTHSYFSNNFREYFGMTPKEFVVKYMDSDDKEVLNRIFQE